MMPGLTDTGKAAWDQAMACAREASLMMGMVLEVGILDGKGADEQHEGSEMTVVAIAGVHEFGATITIPAHEVEIHRKIAADGALMNGGRFVKRKKANYTTAHHVDAYEVTIPSRSFVRSTVDEQKDAILDAGAALCRRVALGELKARQAMKLWGEDVTSRIRKQIQAGIAPGLAPSTIKGRAGGGKGEGGDTPLLDTGHLLRSITYQVRG